MTQADKARALHALHQKGKPLVLYNMWDPGSAKTLAKAGAPALATGSWSVAAAQGYDDGEQLPLDALLSTITRIVDCVDVPVSCDFEGGYATAPDAVGANVARLLETGAVGMNFEDRIVGGAGLHECSAQADRIAAARAAADAADVPFFINARTDLFLGTDPETHAGSIDDALERVAAYNAAGASGFFIPGLTDTSLIQRIVESTDLPVNVMMLGPLKSVAEMAALNVARASYGPGPYRKAQAALAAQYNELT